MTDAPAGSPADATTRGRSPEADAPSFPRLSARTLRFSLGVPRQLEVSPDGRRVLFLRSESGTSRTGSLWVYEVDSGSERLLADPGQLLGSAEEHLPKEELSRRERSREATRGIVSYACDADASMVCFALSGRAWLTDVATGETVELPATGEVIDPRLDPTGRHVAYAAAGGLRLVASSGHGDRALAEPDGDEVVWGQAEFIAAEEMGRLRGFWWSPDGESLLVERYDNSPVQVWYVADPANPAEPPVAHRYPAAGTADAEVTLWHVGLDANRTEVQWDRAAFPYLTGVSWTAHGDPLLQVMSRDQRRALVLAVSIPAGSTRVIREQRDDLWVDLVAGVPAYAPNGCLITAEDSEDTKRICVDGAPVSPVGLQVRAVVGVDEAGVVVTASTEPTEVQLVRVGYDGAVTELTSGAAVHSGESAGGTTAVSRGSLDSDGVHVMVLSDGRQPAELRNHQLYAGFRPRVTMLRVGKREIRTAVLFPTDHQPGSRRLPVIMAPYGGPHGQMVTASSRGFLESQWLADQGFCVVVADGRGTPARGAAWDRSVRDVIGQVTLADQVDALEGVAAEYPDDIDTFRVGITGWSYGGYLSALAVLARPDVFHAAVAGAPVTDQRLYDTFYSERYMGHPLEQPEVYDNNSLLPLAPRLERPLMIIHGMVDDNVVVAHTLRLSAALLAAGRPHTVLPLNGVTHMAQQEEVAENMKRLQVDFLRDALR